MGEDKIQDFKFGDIALNKGLVSHHNLERALSIQLEVYRRAKVYMPIGEILIEMGLLTPEQRDAVLAAQQNNDPGSQPAEEQPEPPEHQPTDSPHPPETEEAVETQPPQEKEKIILSVTDDRLSATISIEDPEDVSPEEIIALIEKNEIRINAVEEKNIGLYLNADPFDNEPLTIARGQAPEMGTPPEMIYHFDVDPMKIGTVKEDGTIDWKDRGDIPQIQSGELVAERTPAGEGVPGIDIFGKPIPPPTPKDVPFKSGNGIKLSDDGTKAFAATDGLPKLSTNGELSVYATLTVSGDVSIETGHIDYDGHIEVSGSVQPGYKVKGRSLRAQDIHDAEITLEDDLVILGGIYNTTINAGGHVKAGHIHNSTIDTIGNLIVNKEMFDSEIESGGKCMIAGGDIVSTKIAAKKGIIAKNIGTEASKPSTIDVGNDYRLERALKANKADMAENGKLKQTIMSQIEQLKERSEQINTELGEIAQVQDKYMVQQRNLEDKLEKAKGIDSQIEENVSTAIDKLAIEQAEIDHQVEGLLVEDEKTIEHISEAEREVQKIDLQLQKLNERHDMLLESAKIDKGLAVAKISGTVFSGTTFKGPHTNIVTQEDHKRVRFGEVQESDSSGSKKWVMKISTLR